MVSNAKIATPGYIYILTLSAATWLRLLDSEHPILIDNAEQGIHNAINFAVIYPELQRECL